MSIILNNLQKLFKRIVDKFLRRFVKLAFLVLYKRKSFDYQDKRIVIFIVHPLGYGDVIMSLPFIEYLIFDESVKAVEIFTHFKGLDTILKSRYGVDMFQKCSIFYIDSLYSLEIVYRFLKYKKDVFIVFPYSSYRHIFKIILNLKFYKILRRNYVLTYLPYAFPQEHKKIYIIHNLNFKRDCFLDNDCHFSYVFLTFLEVLLNKDKKDVDNYFKNYCYPIIYGERELESADTIKIGIYLFSKDSKRIVTLDEIQEYLLDYIENYAKGQKVNIYLLGGSETRDFNRRVLQKIKNLLDLNKIDSEINIIDMSGKFDILGFIKFIAKLDLFVTIDSGPMHFSFLSSIVIYGKIIALFKLIRSHLRVLPSYLSRENIKIIEINKSSLINRSMFKL